MLEERERLRSIAQDATARRGGRDGANDRPVAQEGWPMVSPAGIEPAADRLAGGSSVH